jgi:hypothetical protein
MKAPSEAKSEQLVKQTGDQYPLKKIFKSKMDAFCLVL